MKLNPDCIRDILLTVESLPNMNNYYRFDSKSIPVLFPDYSIEEVQYHIRQCDLNDFLYNVSSFQNGDYIVHDLTPLGHEFLANIRNDTFFQKVKDIGKDLGLSSLKDIAQIAASCATILIKNRFNLP